MKFFASLGFMLTAVFCTGQERLSFFFAGDVMAHQAQLEASLFPDGYDFRHCFRYGAPHIEQADIAVANLEVTLGGVPYTGYPQFSAPDSLAIALKQAGFDVLLTANNHSLDRGGKGLERTCRVLDSLGMPHLGTYPDKAARDADYPLLIEKNGIRTVFLNYTYGTNGIAVSGGNVVNYIDTLQIKKDILKARDRMADIIIACVHWGEEYRSVPCPGQRKLAAFLVRNGVPVVIGGHPHVIQPFEVERNESGEITSVVAYSLGNYLSNMSAPYTDGGATVQLIVSRKNGRIEIENCSYSLEWNYRPWDFRGRRWYYAVPVKYLEDEKSDILLNSTEKQQLDIFTKNTRRLLEEHNRGGIREERLSF